MHFAKLFSLLSLFSTRDWKRCRQFMESPYFGSHHYLLEFFSFLQKHKNKLEKNADYFHKERVYKKLFPNSKCYFSKNRIIQQNKGASQDDFLRKLASDLTKKIEQYLAVEYQLDHSSLLIPFLLRAVEQRKNSELIVKKSEELEKKLKRLSIPDQEYCDTFYQISYIKFLHDYKGKAKNTFGDADSLTDALTHLNLSYLIKCLKILLLLKNRNETLYEQTEAPWKDEVLKMAAHYAEEEDFIRLMYEMLKYDKEQAIPEKLTSLVRLFDEVDSIHLIEHNALLRILANFAIDGFRRGVHQYRTLLVDIYRMGLEKDILIPRDRIQPGFFLNVVTTTLTEWEVETHQEKKTEIIEFYRKFRRLYQNALPEDERGKVLILADAMLFWLRGQVDKALQIMVDFKHYPAFYQLRYRSLQIVCLFDFVPSSFEKEDFFDNSVQSFKSYLNRNKEVHPKRLENYLTFLRFVALLKKYVSQPDSGINLLELETDIHNHQMVYKDWMLKKLEKIKQGAYRLA